MRVINKAALQALRKHYPVGSRVELVSMKDRFAPPVGTHGTVRVVDDIGTVHVAWDTGSTLGVAYGEDEICLVESIIFDPSDWNGIRRLMSEYGHTATPSPGKNEDGEDILLTVARDHIQVVTFQHNGWQRVNTYWADGTREEQFSGRYR